MNGKIIKSEWRSGADSVCIVAVQYEFYWQAYIGASRITRFLTPDPLSPIVENEHPMTTEKRVAEHGCKLSWEEAQVFFPDLNIKNYKTHPECQAFRMIEPIVESLNTKENLSTQASS